MRKRVLAILSGVAIVASTLALVPNEAAAQRGGGFRGGGGFGGGFGGGGFRAADSAVEDSEPGCPADSEAVSPLAGSGAGCPVDSGSEPGCLAVDLGTLAWRVDVGPTQMHAGPEDVGPEDVGEGAAGDGAFLLRLASVAGAGVAGAIHMVAGAGAIRMTMVTVVGSGAVTSGTAATSPMLGIDAEHREPAGLKSSNGFTRVAHASSAGPAGSRYLNPGWPFSRVPRCASLR
jgi:hypothetical protein